jgi:hypothetical protein
VVCVCWNATSGTAIFFELAKNGELADFLAKWLIFGQPEYFSYWYSCFRIVSAKKWDCIEFSPAREKNNLSGSKKSSD